MYVYPSSFRQKAVFVHLPLQRDITEVHAYCMLQLNGFQSKTHRLVGKLEIFFAKLQLSLSTQFRYTGGAQV